MKRVIEAKIEPKGQKLRWTRAADIEIEDSTEEGEAIDLHDLSECLIKATYLTKKIYKRRANEEINYVHVLLRDAQGLILRLQDHDRLPLF